MGLPIPTRLFTISTVSSCHCSVKLAFNGGFSRQRKLCRKSNRIWTPLRISLMSEQDSTSRVYPNQESRADGDSLWGESSKSVEVIGIGSRKDAILDFCLESSFQSSSLRFWNIVLKDSLKVQLLQRSVKKDAVTRNVEGLLSLQSCPEALILVASAGYGLDHITAIELLRTVKSANGLAVGVILKPFSFEGQRRQDEVKDLVKKLREHTNFCVVVDTDALLKKEAVTLAEALKSANNAVLLCINAISVLVSEVYTKLLDTPHNKTKELSIPEVIKIFECYKEAKVGFGAGYNIKSSIARAVFDCPFLGGGVKDFNGMVICTIASTGVLDSSDLQDFLRILRQTTECTREIIISNIHEPNLEPNLIVTTIIVVGCTEQEISPRESFLSRLVLRFPFVFSLLGRDHPESNDPSDVMSSSDSGNMPNSNSVDDTSENLDVNSEEELHTLFSSNYDEIYALREQNSEHKRKDVGHLKPSTELISKFYDRATEGGPAFEREQLISWNVGPGFYIAQEWAKERAAMSVATSMLNNLIVYTLPVGVKPSEQEKERPQCSNTLQPSEPKTLDHMNGEPLGTSNIPSWDVLTDASLEAVMDICNAASTLLRGKYADVPRKQGLLSVRAASMLEAERDSQKKWSPIKEMQYQGGIYKGHCQGGLPEGKGRITFVDGSIYDGMWRYGKKSGLGTFYYSNGDVFQGTWRDDLMHGKGWFYFHTGDRWFANFWKGKANGEGRFYSKFGNVFFGHFQDGWRHGHFLCVDVDGSRCTETWEEGVLLSRKQFNSEISAA